MRAVLAIACALCISHAVVPITKIGLALAAGGQQRNYLPNASTVSFPESVPEAYLGTSALLKKFNEDHKYEVVKAFEGNGLTLSDSTMECLKAAADQVIDNFEARIEIYQYFGQEETPFTMYDIHSSDIDQCVLSASAADSLTGLLQNK